MVHSKVTYWEEGRGNKTTGAHQGEQAGDTVTMGGKDESDEKGEEGLARAHASPRNASPLESPLEK